MENTITGDGPIIVSVAGKGGAGKTSITALLLRSILERGAFEEILVIDADPASNIPDILGLTQPKSIGSMVDRRKESLSPDSETECGPLKEEILGAIANGDGYDYLVMGRTTGKGCYCPLNSILSRALEEFVKLYDLVLIDFDAGLEHFSRETDAQSDILLVVTGPSRMGFETAKRIMQLTDEVGYSYRKRFLLGCGFTKEMEKVYGSYADDSGLTPLGVIPYDSNITTLHLEGKDIFQLDSHSIAYQSVAALWEQITEMH